MRGATALLIVVMSAVTACGNDGAATTMTEERSTSEPAATTAPATEATTTTVDPALTGLAREVVGYLEEIDAEIDEILTGCETEAPDFSEFECRSNVLMGIPIQAERSALVGAAVDNYPGQLPNSVADTSGLAAEVVRLRDEAQACPAAQQLANSCSGTSNFDVLEAIIDLVDSIFGAWRNLV